MEKYISKSTVVAEIEKKTYMEQGFQNEDSEYGYRSCARDILAFLDTLEVKEVDLEKEIANNDHKITIGTKIRSKTNPDVILSIISDDCHEDEFECSNGSVLSLKQIEKYYDIIM